MTTSSHFILVILSALRQCTTSKVTPICSCRCAPLNNSAFLTCGIPFCQDTQIGDSTSLPVSVATSSRSYSTFLSYQTTAIPSATNTSDFTSISSAAMYGNESDQRQPAETVRKAASSIFNLSITASNSSFPFLTTFADFGYHEKTQNSTSSRVESTTSPPPFTNESAPVPTSSLFAVSGINGTNQGAILSYRSTNANFEYQAVHNFTSARISASQSGQVFAGNSSQVTTIVSSQFNFDGTHPLLSSAASPRPTVQSGDVSSNSLANQLPTTTYAPVLPIWGNGSSYERSGCSSSDLEPSGSSTSVMAVTASSSVTSTLYSVSLPGTLPASSLPGTLPASSSLSSSNATVLRYSSSPTDATQSASTGLQLSYMNSTALRFSSSAVEANQSAVVGLQSSGISGRPTFAETASNDTKIIPTSSLGRRRDGNIRESVSEADSDVHLFPRARRAVDGGTGASSTATQIPAIAASDGVTSTAFQPAASSSTAPPPRSPFTQASTSQDWLVTDVGRSYVLLQNSTLASTEAEKMSTSAWLQYDTTPPIGLQDESSARFSADASRSSAPGTYRPTMSRAASQTQAGDQQPASRTSLPDWAPSAVSTTKSSAGEDSQSMISSLPNRVSATTISTKSSGTAAPTAQQPNGTTAPNQSAESAANPLATSPQQWSSMPAPNNQTSTRMSFNATQAPSTWINGSMQSAVSNTVVNANASQTPLATQQSTTRIRPSAPAVSATETTTQIVGVTTAEWFGGDNLSAATSGAVAHLYPAAQSSFSQALEPANSSCSCDCSAACNAYCSPDSVNLTSTPNASFALPSATAAESYKPASTEGQAVTATTSTALLDTTTKEALPGLESLGRVVVLSQAAFSPPPNADSAFTVSGRGFSGLVISVPAGAWPASAGPLTASVFEMPATLPMTAGGQLAGGLAVNFGPEGVKFAKPIGITVPFNRSGSFAGMALGVYKYDVVTKVRRLGISEGLSRICRGMNKQTGGVDLCY